MPSVAFNMPTQPVSLFNVQDYLTTNSLSTLYALLNGENFFYGANYFSNYAVHFNLGFLIGAFGIDQYGVATLGDTTCDDGMVNDSLAVAGSTMVAGNLAVDSN